jgi:hypothetical protein
MFTEAEPTLRQPHLESELERAAQELAAWCRQREFAGHDPFDGLNSRLFRLTPLVSRSRAARLVWTQIFKRSPLNLRRMTGVPAQKNAKGTALFALAALAAFRRSRTKAMESEARALLNDLLAARLDGWSGAAWGYNFDWQGRAFFAPRGTPTIVPTAFAARALVEATRAFDEQSYLLAARSACDFILCDLRRTVETGAEVCFSYSPLDRTRIFNASLLASETLAEVGALTGEKELSEWAVRGARYVVNAQRSDGSWAYGANDYQSWADNFHTAFILTSLSRIMAASQVRSEEFAQAARRGFQFWREAFFLADGWPKYYHDKLYPADAHAAGAAIVALLELRGLDEDALDWAKKIALWALGNLRDPAGFFYYQRRRFYTVTTPYMRWSQAWMLYALSRLLEAISDQPSAISYQQRQKAEG